MIIQEAAGSPDAGFKKGVNRATTQVLMKTGQVERTNDRDFETEQRYALPPTRSILHTGIRHPAIVTRLT
jgi:hypothetical protein